MAETPPPQPDGLFEWLDERIDLASLATLARKKTVPEHRHAIWYYFGGITLFFFIIQLLTGMLLLVYFQNDVDTAHRSVQRITSQIEFGWLFRSVHSWSANLMLASAFVHMFSVYFMKAFRRPRELTWWTGIALLAFGLVFGFSGYLLPWDTLAYAGAKIALKSVASTPGFGGFLTQLAGAPVDAHGNPQVAGATLQRFFALHVVVMPLVFMPLLGLHLWLLQKHGNAIPPDVADEGLASVEADRARGIIHPPSTDPHAAPGVATVPFFPNFLFRDLIVWLLALNLLTLLAAIFPWDLGSAADPSQPAPPGVHPEWYFMAQFELLKLVPTQIPVLFLVGFAGVVAGAYWYMNRVQKLRPVVPPHPVFLAAVLGATLLVLPAFLSFALVGHALATGVVLAGLSTLALWRWGTRAQDLHRLPYHLTGTVLVTLGALAGLGRALTALHLDRPALHYNSELLGMGLFSLAAGGWALVPLWDRGTDEGRRRRRINYIGVVAILIFIGLTALGYRGVPGGAT